MSHMFSSTYSFKKYLDNIESELKIDILRMYILRNEYVHSSNVFAFSSMQPYKIKHVLSLSIDEFFKMLNNRIQKDNPSKYGVIFDSLSEIYNKRTIRDTAFSVLLEDKKYISSISIHSDFTKLNISYETFVYNVLKNNTDLFRKYTAQ